MPDRSLLQSVRMFDFARGGCHDSSHPEYRSAGLQTADLHVTGADAAALLAGLAVSALPLNGPTSRDERPDHHPPLLTVFAEVSRWRHSDQ